MPEFESTTPLQSRLRRRFPSCDQRERLRSPCNRRGIFVRQAQSRPPATRQDRTSAGIFRQTSIFRAGNRARGHGSRLATPSAMKPARRGPSDDAISTTMMQG